MCKYFRRKIYLPRKFILRKYYRSPKCCPIRPFCRMISGLVLCPLPRHRMPVFFLCRYTVITLSRYTVFLFVLCSGRQTGDLRRPLSRMSSGFVYSRRILSGLDNGPWLLCFKQSLQIKREELLNCDGFATNNQFNIRMELFAEFTHSLVVFPSTALDFNSH